MSILDDLLTFARGVADSAYSVIRKGGEFLQRRDEEAQAQEAQAQQQATQESVSQGRGAADILEDGIRNAKERLETGNMSSEEYKRQMIDIGYNAYVQMMRLKQIVNLVEQETGIRLAAAVENAQYSQMADEFQVLKGYFTAIWVHPPSGQSGEVRSRSYEYRGRRGDIEYQVNVSREQYKAEVMKNLPSGSVITSCDFTRTSLEVVEQRLLTEGFGMEGGSTPSDYRGTDYEM